MTAGDEDDDGDEGSDSEPSEDNISEDDLAAIVPLKKEPEPAPVKPVAQPPKPKKPEPGTKRRSSRTDMNNEGKSASSQQKQRPPAMPAKPQQSRSPMKRIMHLGYQDRMRMRQIRKVEMVDAWTQTTPREQRNKERHLHAATDEKARSEQLQPGTISSQLQSAGKMDYANNNQHHPIRHNTNIVKLTSLDKTGNPSDSNSRVGSSKALKNGQQPPPQQQQQQQPPAYQQTQQLGANYNRSTTQEWARAQNATGQYVAKYNANKLGNGGGSQVSDQQQYITQQIPSHMLKTGQPGQQSMGSTNQVRIKKEVHRSQMGRNPGSLGMMEDNTVIQMRGSAGAVQNSQPATINQQMFQQHHFGQEGAHHSHHQSQRPSAWRIESTQVMEGKSKLQPSSTMQQPSSNYNHKSGAHNIVKQIQQQEQALGQIMNVNGSQPSQSMSQGHKTHKFNQELRTKQLAQLSATGSATASISMVSSQNNNNLTMTMGADSSNKKQRTQQPMMSAGLNGSTNGSMLTKHSQGRAPQSHGMVANDSLNKTQFEGPHSVKINSNYTTAPNQHYYLQQHRNGGAPITSNNYRTAGRSNNEGIYGSYDKRLPMQPQQQQSQPGASLGPAVGPEAFPMLGASSVKPMQRSQNNSRKSNVH